VARKTATITIGEQGRDFGKVFVITEMSAFQAEEWAGRALFAMLNAGVEIPENIANAGLAGVASMGIASLTKVPYDAAKPLLDEMLECIQVKPSPNVTRALIDDDIEEVQTLLTLRKEVLNLHLSFFTDGVGSTSAPAVDSPTHA
jgi:hypothetical protein